MERKVLRLKPTDEDDEGDETILIGLYETPDAAKAASTKGIFKHN